MLQQNNMSLAETAFNTWRVSVPPGTTLEKMKEPIYWTHVAHQLRKWDLIRAHYEATDGMWTAEFMVIATDDKEQHWAKVRLLSQNHLIEGTVPGVTPEEPMKDANFVVNYINGQGWRVVRIADQVTMFKNGKTPGDANKWLRDYLAKVAA